MNTLRIDTSNNLVTQVELETSKNKFILEEKRLKPGDQNVLGLIKKLLKNQRVTLKEITSIEVKNGPGSFTGLRVGVSIANALSFALGVPVNQRRQGEVATPKYS
ncbi:MAG: tRNA threonylcarbamoyladenosine biosynthesis protein TsaB [Candidatus Levyibacteriota bacterium]